MPYIETTQGVYSDKNVLEGFSVNTELLCNEEIPDEGDNSCEFYDICIKGINNRFELNKACNIYMLTVEHLRKCCVSSHLPPWPSVGRVRPV